MKGMKSRKCEQCRKLYAPKRRGQRFCAKHCRDAHHNRLKTLAVRAYREQHHEG